MKRKCLELIQSLTDLMELYLGKETEQPGTLFAHTIIGTPGDPLVSLPFSLSLKEE
jgi:hypothetical protein